MHPEDFNSRYITTTSGNNYFLVDQAPISYRGELNSAPTILLLHGFPDSWWGWRYQIKAFSSRGYRVLCPSMLGYAGSSSPIQVEKYSYKSIAYDMNSLLDQCGVKGQAYVIGHDWGGMASWRFCNYFPERVKAIACVCTPYQAPATSQTTLISDEELIRKYMPNFGYQLYFKTDAAVVELEEVVDLFLQPMHSAIYRRSNVKRPEGEMGNWVKEGRLQASVARQIAERRAGTLPAIQAGETEFDFYVKSYKSGSGLRGPLSWYRTRSINFKEEVEANLPPFPSHIPCLQLPAENDAALPVSMCLSKNILKEFEAGGNLEVKVLEGADHWCLQDEKVRDKVTNILCDWIDNVQAGKWKPSGNAVSKL